MPRRPRLDPSFVLCLLVTLTAMASPALAQEPDLPYEPGTVIIKYREGGPAEKVGEIKRALAGKTRSVFRSTGAECVELEGLTVPEAIARFENDPAVEYIEPNYIWSVKELPNDPEFSKLWGLKNTGQVEGLVGADVLAERAWDFHTGSRDIIVGVIDTGVDYEHPDLAANMWTNPGEIPGNGLDDDGNGYVDDVHGYDFRYNDGDPMDVYGHGTHCAGTIGAVGDNGVGVVGVNWHVSLMAVKFIGDDGYGLTDGAVASIEYAVSMGAHVLSNSYGGSGYSQALLDAIEIAADAGVLFVAAAGNSNRNTDVSPSYPAAYPAWNIISVAATTNLDERSYFSNYGPTTVDLGAPGSAIFSTYKDDRYVWLNGTSMACPHVAGAAALLRAWNPALSASDVKELLLNNVDPIPALEGRVLSGGRLNIARAMVGITNIPPAPVGDLVVTESGSSWLEIGFTATGADSLDGTASRYDVRYSTEPITEENFADAARAVDEPLPQPPGSAELIRVTGLEFETGYHLALKVVDELGKASELSNVVMGTTLGPPTMTITPTAAAENLLTGATGARTVTISNPSAGVLDFTVPEPVFDPPASIASVQQSLELAKGEEDPRVGDVVVTDFGGPDGYGYHWVDSDDPSGPSFAWTDISAVGTAVITGGDDVLSEPVPLGFAFPFYGGSFDSIRICSNGYASPTSSAVSFSNQPLPSVAAPDHLIAPFWDDLLVSGSVFYHQDGARFIVQWDGVQREGGTESYTFQMILGADGRIDFQYLSMSEPGWSATVGIQNGDASDGLQMAFNTAFVADAFAVSIYELSSWLSVDPPSGSLMPGESLDVTVLFDAAGLCGGDYHGTITVESNDPLNPAATVDATLTVTSEPDVSVEPAAIGPREYTAGYDHADTLRVASAGCGDLLLASVVSDHPAVTVPAASGVLRRGEYVELPLLIRHDLLEQVTCTITVTSDDPDEPGLVVPVDLTFVAAPRIAMSESQVTIAADTGETGSRLLGVGNTGGADLVWSVTEDHGASPPAAWLEFEPAAGTSPAGGSADVTLQFDATGLCGGDHATNLVFTSNDPLEPLVVVPVTLAVTGRPDVAAPDSVAFGDVQVGWPDAETVAVRNVGCDVLTVSSITVDNPLFTIGAWDPSVQPGDTLALDVTFAPTASGAEPAIVTVLHDDPDAPTTAIALTARGVLPPALVLEADSMAVDLFSGEFADRNILLMNGGDGDLEFAVDAVLAPAAAMFSRQAEFTVTEIPAVAADGEDQSTEPMAWILESDMVYPGLENVLVYDVRYDGVSYYSEAIQNLGIGHVLTTQAYGFRYHLLDGTDWDLVIVNNYYYKLDNTFDALTDFVDAGGHLIYSDTRLGSYDYAIDPRIFDLLGVFYWGSILDPTEFAATDPNNALFNYPNQIPIVTYSKDWLSSYGTYLVPMDGATRVAAFDGYPNNGAVVLGSTGRTICNAFWAGPYGGGDGDGDGAEDIIELLENEIAYMARKASGWLSVEPAFGTVPAGETTAVAVTFNANDLCTVVHGTDIEISTNDPVRPLESIPATLSVTGSPRVAAAPDTIDFGVVFTNVPETLPLTISNLGCGDLGITQMTSDHAAFTVSPTSVVVPENAAVTVDVIFQHDVVESVAATLTIDSDDPGQPQFEIDLTGTCVDPPIMGVVPDSLSVVGHPSLIAEREIIVSNTGASPLDFTATVAENASAGKNIGTKSFIDLDGAVLIVDNSRTGLDYSELAALELGLTTVVTRNSQEFLAQMSGETSWDLIVMDVSGHFFGYDSIDALEEYIFSGGKLIISGNYESSFPMSAIYDHMDIVWVSTLDDPVTVFPAQPAHTMFNYPFHVGAFAPTHTEDFLAFGSVLRLQSGGNRMAGFQGIGFSAIIMNSSETSIYNSFTPSSYRKDVDNNGVADMVELLANQILYLVKDDTKIALEPAAGTVPAGGQATVTVTVELPVICDFSAAKDIVVRSNDPVNGEKAIPISMATEGDPTLQATPDSLDFGTVPIGLTAVETIVLRNGGCGALTGSCAPPGGAPVSVVPAAFSLAPAESVFVTVTYEPLAVAELAGDLVVTSNDPAQPTVNLPLHGSGVEPPLADVTPDTLGVAAFAGEVVTRQLTVGNDGLSPLIWSATLAPPDTVDDWLALSATTGVVEAGAETVLDVVFTLPEECAFQESGQIVLTTNDPLRQEITVVAEAEVLGPRLIAVQPDTVSFEPAFVGVPDTSFVEVVNAGCAPLTVTDVESSSPEMTATPTSFVVPALDRQLVEVVFAGLAPRAIVDSLTIHSDDPVSPATIVALAGTVRHAPQAVVSQDSLLVSLQSAEPGVPVVRRLTLSNTGAGDLTWQARDRYLTAAEATGLGLVTTMPPFVLSYEEPGIPDCYEQALDRVGLPYTRRTSWTDLVTWIDDEGPWDLVVVNARQFGYDEGRLTSLQDHVDDGRRLLMSSPDMDSDHFAHPLGGVLGLVFEEAMTVPRNVVAGLPPSVIFQEPNTVGDLFWDEQRATDIGQFLIGAPETQTLAFFDDAQSHGAVFLGGDGRTIFNAFHAPDYGGDGDGDGVPDMVELLENEIALMARDAGIVWLDVEPESGALAPGGDVELTVTVNLPLTGGNRLAALLEFDTDDPAANTISLPVSVMLGAISSETRTVPSGWALVGPPLHPEPDANTLGAVVLADAPTTAVCFAYAGDAGYVPLERSATVGPGDGMWVNTHDEFDMSMSGTVLPEGLTIPLRHGWNLVGHPHPDPGDLNAVQVEHDGFRTSFTDAATAGIVGGFAYGYDDATQSYLFTDVLQPWHAYWILVLTDGVALWYPPGVEAAAHGPAVASRAAAGWSLELGVDAARSLARIGTREGCGEAYDAGYDLPLPPPAPDSGSKPRVVLRRSEWGSPVGDLYASDFRSTDALPRSWDLEIEGSPGDHILRWSGAGSTVTPELELYDPSCDKVVVSSLRELAEYAFTKGDGPYLLQVRTADFAPELAWKTEGLRLRNVPNPFNPSTRFEFNLPEAGAVRLRIYDVRGAVVRNLSGGVMAAGPQGVEWDGLGDDGARVASGIYFYRLSLDGEALGTTRKMTLLK